MKKSAYDRVYNALTQKTYVSRTYVENVLKMNWNTFRKHVSFLREDGYSIETIKVYSKGEPTTAYEFTGYILNLA